MGAIVGKSCREHYGEAGRLIGGPRVLPLICWRVPTQRTLFITRISEPVVTVSDSAIAEYV